MKEKRERLTYLASLFIENKMTQSEASEFLDLIYAMDGPDRHEEFLSNPANQQKLDAISRQENIAAQQQFDKTLQQFNRGRYFMFRAGLPALLAITALVVYLCHKPRMETWPYDTYNTFADGTKIILRAGSALQHNYQNKREATLTGTAFFDISHNPAYPFVIKSTGNIETKVLGTSFNLNTTAQGYKYIINVATGTVQISMPQQKQIQVKEGEQLRIAFNNSIEKLPFDPIQQNWMKRDLQFTDERMDSIANKLSKRYGIQFQFKKARIPHTVVTTKFQGTESLHEVLSRICELTTCSYILEEKKVSFF
ncbi:FecR family protein [Filimonas lacunae]|uniref:FecR family protein n=1 Tax=Filimonas lacunae TaxID=477680 RepID=A0A173MNX9_9BACT|nr:FecR family protein [Filimonas lacunae]BAV09101.1 anti-sigma factor [Filimonas lacunae]SIS67292.1 FecR family protein [Filimonas lacunae]